MKYFYYHPIKISISLSTSNSGTTFTQKDLEQFFFNSEKWILEQKNPFLMQKKNLATKLDFEKIYLPAITLSLFQCRFVEICFFHDLLIKLAFFMQSFNKI